MRFGGALGQTRPTVGKRIARGGYQAVVQRQRRQALVKANQVALHT
jgi:hypothetical protein